MKAFHLCILLLCLAFPGVVNAEITRFAIVMPAESVDKFEISREAYDGAIFPLFCGIATVYHEENRFEFTKMTDLPIKWIERWLQPIERDGYLYLNSHPPLRIPVGDRDFFHLFPGRARDLGFQADFVTSDEATLPKAGLRFKRTCPYDSKKTPPTDCAYTNQDIDDLYIRSTE